MVSKHDPWIAKCESHSGTGAIHVLDADLEANQEPAPPQFEVMQRIHWPENPIGDETFNIRQSCALFAALVRSIFAATRPSTVHGHLQAPPHFRNTRKRHQIVSRMEARPHPKKKQRRAFFVSERRSRLYPDAAARSGGALAHAPVTGLGRAVRGIRCSCRNHHPPAIHERQCDPSTASAR
jgi:hypothetical protein